MADPNGEGDDAGKGYLKKVVITTAIGAVGTIIAAAVVARIDQEPDDKIQPTPSPAAIELSWDFPVSGREVPICFVARGSLSQELPPGRRIVLGDKGEGEWQFRYDNVSMGSDNRAWEASWTLGSRENPEPGTYKMVAFIVTEARADGLSEGEGTWSSPRLPGDATARQEITAKRTSDQSDCKD